MRITGSGASASRARVIALLATWLALPGALPAQEAGDILDGLRAGGGWVSIPIEGGRGSVRTLPLPTVGMTLSGCVNVWHGHSGAWELRAHELVADTSLVVQALPGVGVPFEHTFGMRAQIDFDVRWSEPRDTTLVLWIGLAVGRTSEEACQPVYGG
jgi:hypothetical protein